MSKPYKRRDSAFWWIAPVIGGIQQPQSTKTTDYQEALDMLRRLEGKIVDGLITTQTNKITVGDLLDGLERDYKIKKRRSEDDVKRRVKLYLKPLLGTLKASTVTGATVVEYVERRITAKASNGTINRELAALKRAFHIGRKSNLIVTIPSIEMLPEDNVRQGFFREDHFAAVCRHANPLLRDVLIVAYYTGWRIDSILHLEWANVEKTVIRLRVNQTKNRKATTFPLAPFAELSAAIERRRESCKGLVTPWVFHREGARVISVRKAWEIARRKAQVPGRLIHDLRRTAVRNLKRQGWSDTEVMNMVGLKTLSMLIRYNITTEEDILAKAESLAKAQKA